MKFTSRVATAVALFPLLVVGVAIKRNWLQNVLVWGFGNFIGGVTGIINNCGSDGGASSGTRGSCAWNAILTTVGALSGIGLGYGKYYNKFDRREFFDGSLVAILNSTGHDIDPAYFTDNVWGKRHGHIHYIHFKRGGVDRSVTYRSPVSGRKHAIHSAIGGSGLGKRDVTGACYSYDDYGGSSEWMSERDSFQDTTVANDIYDTLANNNADACCLQINDVLNTDYVTGRFEFTDEGTCGSLSDDCQENGGGSGTTEFDNV